MLAGCASLSGPVRVQGTEAPAAAGPPEVLGVPAGAYPKQYLFRVRIESREGSGTIRLALRLPAPESQSLEARDRFGGALWRILVDPEGTLLIDDRDKSYCRSGDRLRLPDLALESLPLRGLAAVLLGRLPGHLEAVDNATGEYRDDEGRRWTGSVEDGALRSWTLWQAGEPWVWWRPLEGDGGVLSHRGGSQFRWVRVAEESLSLEGGETDAESDSESGRVPAGYRELDCEDWGSAVGSDAGFDSSARSSGGAGG